MENKQSINTNYKYRIYSDKNNPSNKLTLTTPWKNYRFRIYRENKNYDDNNKTTKSKDKNYETLSKINSKNDAQEINNSIINIFQKAKNFKREMDKLKKENNDDIKKSFSKRLKNFLKLKKDESSNYMKRNNSAIIKPINFDVFKNITDIYKNKFGIIYNKEMFYKDIYKATPIVIKRVNNFKNFYIYNFNKYSEKTKLRKKIENNIENNSNDKINFNKLNITKFYKKLLSSTRKKILKLKKEDLFNVKFHEQQSDYKYKYIKEKDNTNDINKLKEEIKCLNSQIKDMNNQKNKNYFEDDKISNKDKSILKKIFTKSKSIYSFKRIKSTKGCYTTDPKNLKKYFIHDNKNSNTARQNEKEYSILNPITKSTFYSVDKKSGEKNIISDKTNLMNNYCIFDKNHFNNEMNIKDTESIYDSILKMSRNNKIHIDKNIEEYYKSKNCNIEEIQNAINAKELFSFYRRLKQKIDDYDCDYKIKSLYDLSEKNMPKKIAKSLYEIKYLDKKILSSDNKYYLSFQKTKNQ